MYRLANYDVKYLKGVGDNRAAVLADEIDVHSVRDLLFYLPFRHDDRSRIYKISELRDDMPSVQVRGRFMRYFEDGEGARRRLVGLFSDGRSVMEVIWFNRYKSIPQTYPTAGEYIIFGKPQNFRGTFSMIHPEVEVYNPEKPPTGLRGVYSLTEKMRHKGISTMVLRRLVENAFTLPAFSQIEDTLPASVIERFHLMPLRQALRAIHFPENVDELAKARERLKFEELFYLELNILRFTRERTSRVRGQRFSRIGEGFNRFFREVIPFELTSAQKRVVREIWADMCSGLQMNRLLQGDVGCGKTMVAFMTMLLASDNGAQACLMAPTEILAHQHYESLSVWCDRLGLQIRLLTGSTTAKKRREIHAGLLDGSIHFVVGTHALIEEKVQFRNLGLAVIDEQHRFGVAQRARMWAKSDPPPHVLVMTATPIPRTLAMTVYGDLEVSVIDELPPGRKPVTTTLHFSDDGYGRPSVECMVYKQLQEGRQVYFVYPLISENEKLSLRSLEEGYEYVCRTFPEVPTSCVHGRMKPDEKDRQMNRFVSGEARIMVATTVIEVGVNVPNASVMVIENAERFGLSQLHQLRGRVGRGADQSFCMLVTAKKSGGDSLKRLRIMTETTDGFLISEADLKLRGPGDMEGTQQSGIAFNLRIANLATDGQIVGLARRCAMEILDSNPDMVPGGDASSDADAAQGGIDASSGGNQGGMSMSAAEKSVLRRELRIRFSGKYDWSQIS